MLVLKLRRVGKKGQPSYRLIVNERRSKINGRYVDNLGWYNPHSKTFNFNKERVLRWLSNGAQKTDTVHNLLIKAGIISGKKFAVHKKNKVDQENKESKGKMDEFNNQTPQEGDQPMSPSEQPEEQPMEQPSEEPAMPETPITPEAPVSPEGMPAEEPSSAPVEEEAPDAPEVSPEEQPMEQPSAPEEVPAEQPSEESAVPSEQPEQPGQSEQPAEEPSSAPAEEEKQW